MDKNDVQHKFNVLRSLPMSDIRRVCELIVQYLKHTHTLMTTGVNKEDETNLKVLA